MRRLFLFLTMAALIGMPGWAARQAAWQAGRADFLVLDQALSYRPTITAEGDLQAETQAAVLSEGDWVPSQVLVQPGQWVEAGQVLALADPDATQRWQQSRQSAPLLSQLDEQALSAMAAADLQAVQQLAQSQGGQMPQQAAMALYAPIHGTVLEVSISPGQGSQAGSTAFVIAQPGDYRLTVDVAETEVADVQLGAEVAISLPALPGRQFEGVVSAIGPAARRAGEGTSPSVQVEIALHSDDPDLKPGYSAQAAIAIETARPLWMLPYAAIGQDENGQEYVWTLQQGCAVRQDVQVEWEGAYVAGICHENLQTGQVVLCSAAAPLQAGQPVLLTGRWQADAQP